MSEDSSYEIRVLRREAHKACIRWKKNQLLDLGRAVPALVIGDSFHGFPVQLGALRVQKGERRGAGWNGGEHVADDSVGIVVEESDSLAVALRSLVEGFVGLLVALSRDDLGGSG